MTIDINWGPASDSAGRLLVIEGGDGAGKSTQIEILEKNLKSMGSSVLTTRQPSDWYREDPYVRGFLRNGGNVGAARILALLAAADRLRHCAEVIVPALTTHDFVICDRYIYSSLVYFEVRGLEQEFVATINAGIPKPDIAFFIDVPPATTAVRLNNRDRGNLKFEERSLEKLAKVHSGFRALQHLLYRIDGAVSPAGVADQIWSALVTDAIVTYKNSCANE